MGAKHGAKVTGGPTPPLTTQSLDCAAIAVIASQILGKPIAHKVVSDADLRTTPWNAVR